MKDLLKNSPALAAIAGATVGLCLGHMSGELYALFVGGVLGVSGGVAVYRAKAAKTDA